MFNLRISILAALLVQASATALASAYYVASDGVDANNDRGTLDRPFASIGKAASRMRAGDTCYIRGGRYHEIVRFSGSSGSQGRPITFTAYQNEAVTLDGSVAIDTPWTQYRDSIYVTSIPQSVWQLYLDGELLIGARWPNGFLRDKSIWDREKSWAQGLESASSNGVCVDDPVEHDLAATHIDMNGALAVLNMGSWRTATREVTGHSAGSNTFDYAPLDFVYKPKHHYYYLEAKLELLDAEREWFYDANTGQLYLWAPGGGIPTGDIRGKTQSYAFDIATSDWIVIDGLNFFGTTFKFYDSKNVTVRNCDLLYPSCSKRMLKIIERPLTTTIEQPSNDSPSNCAVFNCSFETPDSDGIYIRGADNTLENNYFHNVDMSASELPGLMISINAIGPRAILRRNTIETTGASSTLSLDAFPIAELNRITDTGLLQSDGSMTQVTIGAQPNSITRYNWYHDSEKFGIRFDAQNPPVTWGSDGIMHHNVTFNTNTGLLPKGSRHSIYNNTSFDNAKQDIAIHDDTDWPGHGGRNAGTITRNNVANKLTGKKGSGPFKALPGASDHNWNGYETGLDIRTQLRDPDNYDFRPKASSDLVDQGLSIEGITGPSPDIGAYESDATHYWIPGRKRTRASSPIPPLHATHVKADADLIWLEGLEATSHKVYWGSSPETLLFQGTFTASNIFAPPDLAGSTTYYWRVDAITPQGVITGKLWSFTVENPSL